LLLKCHVFERRIDLSAKWRRSRKNPRRFDIFKVISRVRDRSAFRKLNVKESETKWQARRPRYRVQKIPSEKGLKEPRPLVDVLEGCDDIIVVAEFAGFDRKDLRMHLKDQRLVLSAEASDRKFHKSLNLPKRVIPNTICTTYKNGVLEIRLKKAVEQKAMTG
jgi:HSP20 family molecular chaperone IbpA